MTRPDSADERLDPDQATNEGLAPEEATDEDELGTDPLERAMDPPEHWTGADRYGTTPAEEATERPLDSRLREEQPDVRLEQIPDRPIAATALQDLDESIDDVDPEDLLGPGRSPSAGKAGYEMVAPGETTFTGAAAVDTEGSLVTEPDAPTTDETLTVRDPGLAG
ncbi:MAG TPA: hypothetical protein VFQ77_00665 [Pseudonocardiaceae bacterium]|nr:hypothetical protein [Pseudonocardiaceae bacterium]